MPKKIPKEVRDIQKKVLTESTSTRKISYSHLSMYANCPKQWYLTYVKKLAPYSASIHTLFGTSMHETIQEWLKVMYEDSVKAANAMDLNLLLYTRLFENYKKGLESNNKIHFTTEKELTLFYLEGTYILDYLKKHRAAYFGTKGIFLAGIEVLLYQEISKDLYFKGYIDLVFYDSRVDEWKLLDIKTSTKGWSKWDKADHKKTAQLLLYREFFSKQFDIPLEKIKVEYLIVKRQVPVDAEYASMQKRVQEFAPASGRIKRGQTLKLLDTFIKEAIDDKGQYLSKDHFANAEKNTCRFCYFKGKVECPEGV